MFELYTYSNDNFRIRFNSEIDKTLESGMIFFCTYRARLGFTGYCREECGAYHSGILFFKI